MAGAWASSLQAEDYLGSSRHCGRTEHIVDRERSPWHWFAAVREQDKCEVVALTPRIKAAHQLYCHPLICYLSLMEFIERVQHYHIWFNVINHLLYHDSVIVLVQV